MQQSVTRLHPEGSVYNESDSGDDVIKTGPGTLCEKKKRRSTMQELLIWGAVERFSPTTGSE